MYQALYRKYRPQNFDEVVGQDVIVTTLKNAIINNKISHAYLFTGMRGTGKTTIAKILAKTINCENLSEAIPCEKCVSCTQINNKQNIDIIEIDAASNNGVDEIRELRSKVSLVPSISKYKVYIIDEVHMLTQGAFNALLKTLEEPPKHIVFILATTEPQKIPLTILSRCQRFDFKKISNNTIEKQISKILTQENLSMDEAAIKEIARLSYGGMRDAISILDQALAYSDSNVTLEDIHIINGTLPLNDIKKIVNSIINKDIASILLEIDQYDNNGINFVKIIDELITFLKNVLFNKIVPNFSATENINDDIYLNMGKDISSETLIDYIEKLNESATEMRMVSNKRLIFELTFIKLLSEFKQSFEQTKSTPEPPKLEKKIEKAKENPIVANLTVSLPNDFENLKQCRINNTLAHFDRKRMLELRKNMDMLRSALIVPEYSEVVSLVLDSKINAVSDEYIVFVFSNMRMAEALNINILLLEKIIREYLNINYKVIATDENDWDAIKEKFNNKTEKYDYTTENFDLEKMLSQQKQENKDVIEETFADVVTYE